MRPPPPGGLIKFQNVLGGGLLEGRLNRGKGGLIKFFRPIARVIVFAMQSFSLGRMSAGVSPTGGRYLEDGLVVPGKHLASARDKQLITILMKMNELDKKAERLMCMNLKYVSKIC